MTDETPRAKRMGRPPKHPDQGKRPSVSLRVSQALYDKIQNAAQASNRSMSEEMEHRIERVFSDDAEDFNASVTAAAAEAIRDKVEKEYDESFGGRLNVFVSIKYSELFVQCLNDARAEWNDDHGPVYSDGFQSLFAKKLSEKQEDVVTYWAQMMMFAQFMTSFDMEEGMKKLKNWFESTGPDDELKKVIIKKLGIKPEGDK